jgi:LuxR family maltose regulon positive regulatory protein
MSEDLRTSAVTPSGDPIMAAKFLVPTLPPWAVTRQRLVDGISRGVHEQLTLISAPAGCGKTVLAASWVAAGLTPGPVAWLSLDEDDDRAGVFWSYVLTALARVGVPVAGVGMPALADQVDQSVLIRLAAALSERSEPVVLILDGAQVLTGRAVLDGLDFLLRHAGNRLRLVILTRDDPALPLHRYRLAGSMTEVRLDQLAFTAVEGRAVLAAHHTDLPEAAATALAERAQGWAAGLRLAALSLQNRTDTGRLGAPATAGDSEIAAYFLAEFLDVQPPGIREFLLRTSVVDRISPDLATILTGRRDAGSILARLAYANTFVTPSAGDNGGYEYRPLIRDLLLAQLREESPRRIGRLHRKAADWFATKGRLTDATGHAVAAGDWGHAAWLLIDDLGIGRLLTGPQGVRNAETFAGMPSGTAGPEAAVVRSAVALARLDIEACAKHLLQARELVPDGSTDHTRALQLAIAVTEVVSAGVRGDVDGALSAMPAAESQLAEASAADLEVPATMRALIPFTKGSVLLAAGDLSGAGVALAEGLRGCDGPGGDYLRIACLGQLALVEVHRGQLRKATEFARRANTAANRCGLAMQDRPPAVDVALAWVHMEEYDLAAARVHCDRAAASSGIRVDPVSAASLALADARLHRARSDLAGAVAIVDRARATLTTAPVPPWLLDRLAVSATVWRVATGIPDAAGASTPVADLPRSPQSTLALASTKLADGDVATAATAAAEMLRRPRLALDAQVDGWLLTAACELAQGRADQARKALDQSLSLAATEKLRRPVIEAAPPLRRFLRQDRELAERHAWLGTPVVGSPEKRAAGVPTAAVTPIVEPLTDKETEVLRHLAALSSTEEIARTMFVSVNTVKTHVRGILRKLAASRRNEAIRRARELGLV